MPRVEIVDLLVEGKCFVEHVKWLEMGTIFEDNSLTRADG
jgi:hypothetical protein